MTAPHHPSTTPTSLPTSMFAGTRRSYGGPEVVAVASVDRPAPGPGEVLVRVAAAGLDRATLHLLTGLPYLARLAFGIRRPRQVVLGQQVAGEVVELGEGVSEYAVGDRVFGTAKGSFAEFAAARVATLALTPAALSDDDAATLGVSGLSARTAVLGHGQVQPGQRVLVLGGSGAVGSFAVQLAAHLGAEVTAAASASKLDLVRELGARHAVDYRTTPVGGMGGPFDVVIDIGGSRPVRSMRAAMTSDGALVIVGGEGGGSFLGGIDRNLVAGVVNRFTRQRVEWFFGRTTTAGCAQLGELVAAGAVRPAVDDVVGLDGLAAALGRMQRGELRGQVVVRP